MKRKAVSGWQVVTIFLRGSLEENVSKGTLWSPVASVLFWPVNPLCCVDVFFWNWSARKKKGAKQADAKRRKAELRPHCWCWKARFLHRRPGHTKRVTMLCVCVCVCATGLHKGELAHTGDLRALCMVCRRPDRAPITSKLSGVPLHGRCCAKCNGSNGVAKYSGTFWTSAPSICQPGCHVWLHGLPSGCAGAASQSLPVCVCKCPPSISLIELLQPFINCNLTLQN